MFILEVILTLFIFFSLNYITWKICDDIGLPEFLNYYPYICRKCINFWIQLLIYPTIFIISNYDWWYLLIMGEILNALNTLALHIDEKNNTCSINDIKDE